MTEFLTLTAPDPDTTARIAVRLGGLLRAGDVILLHGPVGAGKSHLARALIQSRLSAEGRAEHVPSPTFTLVQTYALADVEIWHADLYRLQDPMECVELGLDLAFDQAICLVEWPERLGALTPKDALHLTLTPLDAPDARRLSFAGPAIWATRLGALA